MSSGRQAGGQLWVGFSNCKEHIVTEGGECVHCRNAELEAENKIVVQDMLLYQKQRDEYKATIERVEEEVERLESLSAAKHVYAHGIAYTFRKALGETV